MENCNQCKSPFETTTEDLQNFRKFGYEPDNLCFECGHKNRLCFRNERMLYRRKCDFSGEDMISIYSPDKPYKVYRSDIWNGDKWNALDYGRDFDFSRPFFEQFHELQMAVPRSPLVNVNSENSEYCNMCVGNKNCYLVFGGDFNQDVLYGTLCMYNVNSAELDLSNRNELCYMCGDVLGSYGCHFAFDSKNCRNCYFISDCSNCFECILCTNLSGKSFCVENRQLSKEEYLEKKKELLKGSYAGQQELWRRFLELRKNRVVKFAHIINCQNCSGDYLKNSKNCLNSYDASESEDLRNVIVTFTAKDCFNASYVGQDAERVYNSVSILGASSVSLSYYIFNSSDIEYSEQILNSHYCFGCNGLNHQEFCIFNKKYSKDEYVRLRDKIIGHMKKTGEWGRFFPAYFSCFGYNEATAHQFYPLTRVQALSQGYKWKDDETQSKGGAVIDIPDNIKDVEESMTNEILACAECGKGYKVIPQELKFYRLNNIPVPHACSECRHRMRLDMRNPKKLWPRNCQKCGVGFQTTYAPERPEKVYCEECYLKEVY